MTKFRKEPKSSILIVTEGQETERNYCNQFRLHRRVENLEIRGGFSTPILLVKETQRILSKYPGYKRAYCLFDRDKHPSFEQALVLIDKHNRQGGIQIRPIISNPCFELWFLLHYQFSTNPFEQGEKAWKTIVKKIPAPYFRKYEKKAHGIFKELQDKTSIAIKHGNLLAKHQNHDPRKSPFTHMHQLVQEVFLRKT